MPLNDLSRPELVAYRPELDEPDDLDAFWTSTLAEARSYDLALELTPVDAAMTMVELYDVTFAGWGGHPIKGWLARPAGVTGP
ncbi:MAG: acetylxylan esterase, partial [Cellulomonas sp.]